MNIAAEMIPIGFAVNLVVLVHSIDWHRWVLALDDPMCSPHRTPILACPLVVLPLFASPAPVYSCRRKCASLPKHRSTVYVR